MRGWGERHIADSAPLWTIIILPFPFSFYIANNMGSRGGYEQFNSSTSPPLSITMEYCAGDSLLRQYMAANRYYTQTSKTECETQRRVAAVFQLFIAFNTNGIQETFHSTALQYIMIFESDIWPYNWMGRA